jgi:hypothetical protein
MFLYALTIFLSAFLLFQVQPLIAKIILPWFGGSAAVWSAAMLFFQVSLLAGYAYAHYLIGNFKAKRQMQIHGALLLISAALLPILPNPYWKPTQAGDPTLRILMLLAATIGLPYFLLSSTSPLLQAWYVRRSGSGMPYRLFALSNFGSMLGLITFPFWVEPRLASRTQAYTWSGIYVAFVVLCGLTAWISQNPSKAAEAAELATSAGPKKRSPAPTIKELAFWVALAACASILLVSATNHLSQNVAPIPLLWVIPLALYLLSFILCFESDKIYQRWLFVPALAALLGYMAYYLFADSGNTHIKLLIPMFAGGLFCACMVCHGELARRKPAPDHLTLFYLMVSLGGALGGVMVALVAPHVLHSYLELPIGMALCALLTVIALWDIDLPKLGGWAVGALFCLGIGAGIGYLAGIYFPGKLGPLSVRLAVGMGLCATVGYLWLVNNKFPKLDAWPLRVALCIGLGALSGYLVRHQYEDQKTQRLSVRNFYGVLRIHDDDLSEPNAERSLTHGTINHGSQLLAPELRYVTTSYYGENSGIGRAIRAIHERGPARIGSIGLGAAVISNYGKEGDYLRIFEINPLVEGIAQTWFSFYPHAQADKKIMMGDARLTLENELKAGDVQNFDVLSVDAFSSDAIPIHLLTREALDLYFHHLKPNGILALHISNRYLDLAPVCASGAAYFHKEARTVNDDGGLASYFSSSTWVLVTSDPSWFQRNSFVDADMSPTKFPPNFRAWTDDYSNIVQILRLN